MSSSAFFEQLRPELHRYCARLTGSVMDGEDLVQETMLASLTSAPTDEPARLRAWAFRTAHNRAVDRWRSYEQRMREPLSEHVDTGIAADEALARNEAMHAALSRYVALPPLQRSCVILKDVLDHSLADVASLLETTVPAVQAALHRGRRELREATEPAVVSSPTLHRYAALFNARDWDGFRAMLADDVRLEVIAKFSKRGRENVGGYVGNYSTLTNWSASVEILDGREVLMIHRNGQSHPIAVSFEHDKVVEIRDYFHVPWELYGSIRSKSVHTGL